MVGGALVTSDDDLAEQLRFLQNAAGAVPGPMDCWLALRGTKTLAVRMKRHEENARALADLLARHSGVSKVFYPGLVSHPQHELAKRQASGFGGMVTFIPGDGSLEAGRRVFDRFRLFTRAESLGGREPGLPPGLDDPRLGAEGDPARDRICGRPAPPVGRDRRPGRFAGRPRVGAPIRLKPWN
jgi:cystathionine beta-lyase/cystathionine gamma-synthase